jgi:hypothetical protein
MNRATTKTGAKLAATTTGPALATRATEVATLVLDLAPAQDSAHALALATAAMGGIDPAAGRRQWPRVLETVVKTAPTGLPRMKWHS